LNTFTQYRPIKSYACFLTPELKYVLLILPKYELGKAPRDVTVTELCFETKPACSVTQAWDLTWATAAIHTTFYSQVLHFWKIPPVLLIGVERCKVARPV